ncbi:MAG: copper resistance protein CopC [Actinomycetales bacterium]|nr:copper resistance protein CopC [Actinomycetales bacterium]
MIAHPARTRRPAPRVPSSPAARRSRAVARVLAVLAVLAVVFLPLAALAHDQLITSVPGDGETLTEFPTQISLEFNNELIDAAPALLIRDAASQTVYRATPEVSGRLATAPFPELPDGDYRINWSVVSSDGHRIEGSMPFVMATGLTGGATPVATQEATTEASTQAPAGEGGLADLPAATRIAIGVGGVAAAAGVLAVVLRARRGGIRGQ